MGGRWRWCSSPWQELHIMNVCMELEHERVGRDMGWSKEEWSWELGFSSMLNTEPQVKVMEIVFQPRFFHFMPPVIAFLSHLWYCNTQIIERRLYSYKPCFHFYWNDSFLAAETFPFLLLPFESCPLARGILLGKKKVEIAILYILYMYISACGLVWLSFVNISLSLWSSETPAGSGLSLTHVSFTQSLELYVTNVFRIEPLKDKLLHLRWHKQGKHTKSKLREFYFFLANIRNIQSWNIRPVPWKSLPVQLNWQRCLLGTAAWWSILCSSGWDKALLLS